MLNMTMVFLILPAILLFPSISTSATHRVPDEYATIQAGIDASVDGDTILVADGIYTGSGNKNINYDGKAVSVLSENGPERTVIDCENSGRGFHFRNGEGPFSRLEGFTLRGGCVDYSGGGICCRYYSSPTITNCFITGNRTNNGGGIYCLYSSPTITKCTITENTTSGTYGDGGGILCAYDSSPIIRDCTITGNIAEFYGGGILCAHNSSPIIANCTIEENKGDYGGGIYCGEASPTITECTISWNIVSMRSGGGIHCYKSSPIITNCSITGNTASGSECYGGGICCYRFSHPTITNCTITENTTSGEGGGVYCSSSSPLLTNCTITENISSGDGGGIYCRVSSDPIITNCILWSDSPDEVYVASGDPVVAYSDIQGGWVGEGNIDEDPLFTLKSWFGFDYGLRTVSPCIDSGDPAFEDALYDWHPLCPDWYINGPDSDMGAYGGPGNIDWFK